MDGEQQQLRNLRDFLMVYNKMTEQCFNRCASNLSYRSLTNEEGLCLDSCASKLIRSNHRLMAAYVGLMPGIVQRRMADYENMSMQGAAASPALSQEATGSPALSQGAAGSPALSQGAAGSPALSQEVAGSPALP